MSIFRRGAIAHVRHGIAYHVGNSIRGLRAARRVRKRKADRDLQMTKDGVVVVCHWPRPLRRDGFIDPLGHIGKGRTVASMTWAEVSRLRTRKGGYRINTLDADLAECGRLGIQAVVEPKGDPRFRSQRVWDEIKADADRHHARISGYALHANAGALPYMRRAGIPAHELRG